MNYQILLALLSAIIDATGPNGRTVQQSVDRAELILTEIEERYKYRTSSWSWTGQDE